MGKKKRERIKWSGDNIHGTKCGSFKFVKVTELMSKSKVNTTNTWREEKKNGCCK